MNEHERNQTIDDEAAKFQDLQHAQTKFITSLLAGLAVGLIAFQSHLALVLRQPQKLGFTCPITPRGTCTTEEALPDSLGVTAH